MSKELIYIDDKDEYARKEQNIIDGLIYPDIFYDESDLQKSAVSAEYILSAYKNALIKDKEYKSLPSAYILYEGWWDDIRNDWYQLAILRAICNNPNVDIDTEEFEMLTEDEYCCIEEQEFSYSSYYPESLDVAGSILTCLEVTHNAVDMIDLDQEISMSWHLEGQIDEDIVADCRKNKHTMTSSTCQGLLFTELLGNNIACRRGNEVIVFPLFDTKENEPQKYNTLYLE